MGKTSTTLTCRFAPADFDRPTMKGAQYVPGSRRSMCTRIQGRSYQGLQVGVNGPQLGSIGTSDSNFGIMNNAPLIPDRLVEAF